MRYTNNKSANVHSNMGVTYRYMGISYSLRGIRKRSYFLLSFIPIRCRRLYREPSLSKRGKSCEAERTGEKSICYQKPMWRWDITANKKNEKSYLCFNGIINLVFCKLYEK